MLRRLQHPTARAPQEREHLQHLFHVRVVRALVEREVEVAPGRHTGQPFECVRREVEVLELDLLLDRARVLVVHRPQERHHLDLRLVVAPAPLEPRIHAVTVGPVTRARTRLAALPVGQRAQPRVGGHQVHEVGRARSRQPDDDDRRRQLDARGSPGGGARRSSTSRRAERSRTVRWCIASRPSWSETRCRPRPRRSSRRAGHETRDRRIRGNRFARAAFASIASASKRTSSFDDVVERRALRGVELGLGEVVDREISSWPIGLAASRRCSTRASRAARISPSSHLVIQKFARSCSGEQRLVRPAVLGQRAPCAGRPRRAPAHTIGSRRADRRARAPRRGARPRPVPHRARPSRPLHVQAVRRTTRRVECWWNQPV